MDTETVVVYVTAAGIIVTAILSILDGRRQSRLARAAADRAEAAGRISDSNAQRVIVALETMAAGAGGGSLLGAAGLPQHVRWAMVHDRGDTYRLTNAGTLTAHDVDLRGHESLIGPQMVTGGPTLQPGEALTFIAARSLATSDSTITVQWVDSSGDPGIWNYPLPPKT